MRILLSLICLFIFKTSIVEADDISLSEDGDRERSNTYSPESCGNALIELHDNIDGRHLQEKEFLHYFSEQGPSRSFIQLMMSEIMTNKQKYKEYTGIKFREDPLLNRIRLMENQQDLESQGYGPEYIANFDYIKNGLQIAYHLRQRFKNSNTNPEEAHIPEFADLIDSHIDFIERAIRNQNSPDRYLRLQKLMELRHNAQLAKNTRKVTYRYYLALNFQLIILTNPREDPYSFYLRKSSDPNHFHPESIITPDMDYDDISIAIIEKLFSDFIDRYSFPEVIIMPTIESSGNIGIISENRTSGTDVHFIALNDKPTYAHGWNMSPLMYLSHDLAHTFVKPTYDMNLFIELFFYNLRSLPKSQRQRIELVFYELTHESGYRLSTITEPIQEVVARHLRVDPKDPYDISDFSQFIPGHNHTLSDVNAFLQQARDDFVRFFHKTRAKLTFVQQLILKNQ